VNKREAYRLGVASGYEAGIYGDFTAEELSSEDAFTAAAAEICENKGGTNLMKLPQGGGDWSQRSPRGGNSPVCPTTNDPGSLLQSVRPY
jgi:hypothetical protein